MAPKEATPLLQRPPEAATRTTPVQTGPFKCGFHRKIGTRP